MAQRNLLRRSFLSKRVLMGDVQTDLSKIGSDLRKLVEGEVLDEEWHRAMYATDASAYKLMPACVVVPKTVNDVVAVVKYAKETGIPITPRGAGSGLAGQALGEGIILDFSKYLNKILEVNPDQNFVVIQPGVYKSELDKELKRHGKFLPPDPSSAEYCTVGGMIANNSGGAHSVKYGNMIDYVLSLDVVLSNGEIIRTEPMTISSDTWRQIATSNSEYGRIVQKLHSLAATNAKTIAENQPVATKNVAGYRLERLIRDGVFDFSKLITGSEGTLGIIVAAKVSIMGLPRRTGVAVIHFESIDNMARSVAEILKAAPSAVEFLDKATLDLAKLSYPDLRKTIPDTARAVLIVEFDGHDDCVVASSLERLQETFVRVGLASHFEVQTDAKESARLWDIRKKAVGVVLKIRGRAKPVPFIEDVAVRPSDLARYFEQLHKLLGKYSLSATAYGHAGVGLIHARPLFDLKSGHDLKILEKFSKELFDYVIGIRGTISGEHGDGLARAGFLREQYGEQLYGLFVEVKRTCDRAGILAPLGKIPLKETRQLNLDKLRYGQNYSRREIAPVLNWQLTNSRMSKLISGYDDELSYAEELELCHGCGRCRSRASSIRMCPVFAGFQDEVDSCRGRNNVLRWLLQDEGLPEEFCDSEDYREIIFEHCVECKMCLIDCPSNVNVGKLMADARARYASRHGLPRGYGFFVHIDRYARIACMFAPVANLLFTFQPTRVIIEWLTGIDRNRNFPMFRRTTFNKLFRRFEKTTPLDDLSEEVVFFYDTYVNYNAPELGIKIVQILARNGYRTIVPEQMSSGLPALMEGNPEIGRRTAEYNIKRLLPYALKGTPIVCFSPSAGLALKMEYLDALNTEDARRVASQTFDIHEFLYELHKRGELDECFKPVSKDVYIHLHCHSKVQRVEEQVYGLLTLIPSLKIQLLEEGCCGVGGSYSFIKGNLKKSLRIGEQLFGVVRRSAKPVYSTGESCSLQIEKGSGVKIPMTMELLAEAYGIS
jgi:FAD/FMN-containing dehydrogenase/Fe-S oxidoreductase